MSIKTVGKSLAVFGIIACAVLFGLNQVKKSHERGIREVQIVDRAAGQKFTFDDIYNSDFSYKSYSVNWISGTEYIYKNDDDDIMIKDVEGKDTPLLPGTEYTNKGGVSYKVSADRKYVAVLTEYKKGWRHSYNGTYLIYSVDDNMWKDDWKTPENTQYFVWSTKENALAYVNGFNIYYRPGVGDAVVQVTDDGRANHIYNGIPDWVYEEEMISSNNVMYFSPGGDYLAFARFDDSTCKHIQFARYDDGIYPNMLDVSYPKAGTTQPTNKVFIYGVSNNTLIEVAPPANFSDVDYLFNAVTWASNSEAAVTWCDRYQAESVMRLVTINESSSALSYVDSDNFQHSSETGWLYQRRPYWIPVFGNSASEFFTVRPSSKWQHVYYVSKDSGKKPLTEGEWTVTSESAAYPSIELYDAGSNMVYFSGTKESPQHRHIYRAKTNPGETLTDPECITCKYATEYEGRCDYITTQFSTDGSYVIVKCNGDGVPLYIQAKLNHGAANQEDVLTDKLELEMNKDLVNKVGETDMSSKEYGDFPSSSGYTFRYQLWKPPNFDETKKYPLLIDVYAGPGYQRVYAGWSRGWQTRFLPSSLDVVVASVDGRGSNYYGDEFMHEVYLKLGQFEPLDQLEFAKFLAQKNWIDETNVAAWGWSYGGYTTSLILGNDADNVMKCGFAVAPLTDWRFYDTIYAERYMRSPKATDGGNKEGYDKAAVLPLAKNIKPSAYYLIHGTADDNVHFQNSARIQRELVDKDIDFNAFFYGDQDHSINVGNARKHVYKILTKQVCKCFGLTVPDGVWSK